MHARARKVFADISCRLTKALPLEASLSSYLNRDRSFYRTPNILSLIESGGIMSKNILFWFLPLQQTPDQAVSSCYSCKTLTLWDENSCIKVFFLRIFISSMIIFDSQYSLL